ncbi:hypothetical protein C4568_03765 [Candidatus Parcubacteria bacterium]|nr:MAG: hypothetical protein C4568_03765 [Candidatus Parcubacteria bacterium]
MKILTNHVHLIVLAAVIVALGAYSLFTAPKVVEGSVYDATVIGVATSSAAVSVTSSQTILATTTSTTGTSYTRVYATVCNPSTTVVYLNMDNGKVAALANGAFTVAIAAASGYDACFEITDRNQYSGTITASSTNQTAVTVYAKQYVQ